MLIPRISTSQVLFITTKERGEDAVTPKQKRFCEEYLVDCNATQAAIRAGYSEKTAKTIGSENMAKPDIKSYIDERLSEMQSKTIADATEVLQYLTSVLRGDVKDETLRFVGDGYQEKTKIQVGAKDRTKAAELLGKRYGLFTDKIDLENKTKVVIVDDLDE